MMDRGQYIALFPQKVEGKVEAPLPSAWWEEWRTFYACSLFGDSGTDFSAIHNGINATAAPPLFQLTILVHLAQHQQHVRTWSSNSLSKALDGLCPSRPSHTSRKRKHRQGCFDSRIQSIQCNCSWCRFFSAIGNFAKQIQQAHLAETRWFLYCASRRRR